MSRRLLAAEAGDDSDADIEWEEDLTVPPSPLTPAKPPGYRPGLPQERLPPLARPPLVRPAVSNGEDDDFDEDSSEEPSKRMVRSPPLSSTHFSLESNLYWRREWVLCQWP
jgi:hypothetical protein